MKKPTPFIPLFNQFVKETESGKRLKKNGERIKKSSARSFFDGILISSPFIIIVFLGRLIIRHYVLLVPKKKHY